jgi:hypothetical protein
VLNEHLIDVYSRVIKECEAILADENLHEKTRNFVTAKLNTARHRVETLLRGSQIR